MCTVSIYELKAKLSKYISLIESGEEKEIKVTKNGNLVATIIPPEECANILVGSGKDLVKGKSYKVKGKEFDDINSLFGF